MDINELISSLTPDDINKLKVAANSLLGNSSSEQQNNQTGSPLPFDSEMLSAVRALSSKFNGDDDRTALIKAIKPMLSEQRRQKADEAIKILRLISLIPVLRESGLLKDLL